MRLERIFRTSKVIKLEAKHARLDSAQIPCLDGVDVKVTPSENNKFAVTFGRNVRLYMYILHPGSPTTHFL